MECVHASADPIIMIFFRRNLARMYYVLIFMNIPKYLHNFLNSAEPM